MTIWGEGVGHKQTNKQYSPNNKKENQGDGVSSLM